MKQIFIILSLIMAAFIYLKKDKIHSDIFTLLPLENSKILKSFNDETKKQIVFLAPDINATLELVRLNEESKIFSNLRYKFDDINELKNELNIAKLALFKGEIDNELFKNALKMLFNPFYPRILSIKDDPLNLASQTNLFNENQNISLDINDGILKTKDGKFIFIKGVLNDKFSQKELIYMDKKLKKLGVLSSGGAKFAAYNRESSENDGLKLGLLSIFLTFIFLHLAFRNVKILHLFWVAIFGYICGLSASLAVFSSIHVLVLVICISLIGLMLDFSCCWLGVNRGEVIKKESINSMLSLFLTACFITALGYLLFLFSEMEFLKQIAVFSSFAMIGAFLATYFLLPNLLNDVAFKEHKIFSQTLNLLQNLSSKIAKILRIKAFWAVCFLILAVCVFKISHISYHDDVKNYSQNDPALIKETKKINDITKNFGDMKFIECKNGCDELSKSLIFKGLIDEYLSLEKIINLETKQSELVAKIELLQDKFKEQFLSVGIKFDSANKLKILSKDGLKGLKILSDFSLFFDNENLMLVKNPKLNDEFFNTIKGFDARYFDMLSQINDGFTQIKTSSIFIKFYGYLATFLILLAIFKLKKALIVTLTSISCMVLTLGVFALFDNVDIFVVFGLIVSSAVGIDYLLFCLKNFSSDKKMFGIFISSMTSIISFFVLGLSGVNAVSNFGLSVALNLTIICLFCFVFINNDSKISIKH